MSYNYSCFGSFGMTFKLIPYVHFLLKKNIHYYKLTKF